MRHAFYWQKLNLRYRTSRIAVMVVATSVLVPTSGWAATEVNTCGQVFSGNGFLSADLDCTGFPGNSVGIDGGKLDLRGFTVTGGSPAINCTRSCQVVSDPPGGVVTNLGVGVESEALTGRVNIKVRDITITGGGAAGINTNNGSVVLRNATVASSSNVGVWAGSHRATLRNSVVTGSGGVGIISNGVRMVDSEVSFSGQEGMGGSGRTVSIRNSTVSGNGAAGINGGPKIKVLDSTVTGNTGPGIRVFPGDSLRVIRSTVDGNSAEGILSQGPMTIRDSTVSNNGLDGIFQSSCERFRLVRSTVTGNMLHGARQFLPFPATCCNYRATGSTLTGNALDASCGVSQTCADVATCSLPDLASTSCDTSYDVHSGFPGTSWGVCALD